MAGVSQGCVSGWICVIEALFIVASYAAGDNSILYQLNANGSAVVLQAISTLRQSGVFGNDNELLRRIAYVETRDGRLTNVSSDGGIWAVKENKFMQTKAVEANTQLLGKLKQIQSALGLNWMLVQWRDLRMPLHSLIGARLVLYLTSTQYRIPPANDLEAQARFWVQYYNPDGDQADFIGTSHALQGGILDSSANEFFLGFSKNFDNNYPQLQLFVTTTESRPVTFIVNAAGFNYSGIAEQNSSIVTLPKNLQVRNESEGYKGIYVKAEGNKKIVVYGINYAYGSTDAFLALPCNRLPVDEYEYFAVTYPSTFLQYLSTILIVACEDNTIVNTGQSTSVILNRLQTYLIRSIDDLTGRRITTNKPIAFFSNHECASVPFRVGYCDHLTEQIPPTSTWGRVFMAASLLGRRSGDLFRIVAAKPPTNVAVSCTNFTQPVSYLLTAARNWQEYKVLPDSFCSITATAPILVTQFALGSFRGGPPGDPFMMMISPLEQFNTNSYVFNNLFLRFQLNYITVYVEPEYFQPDRIFVNEFNLKNSFWSQIRGCSATNDVCGYVTWVNLTNINLTAITFGDTQLYHLDQNAKISASVYGFSMGSSYGYPGGLKLTPLQFPVVSFSSATYIYDEGIGGVQITITRSGNRETPAVVMITNDSIQINVYDDRSVFAQPILEFQSGETEKLITITCTCSDITEIELYLSTGEGIYLSPFPRTIILNITLDLGTDTSKYVCSWCIIIGTGATVFTVVGVIIVACTPIVIKLKTKKQPQDEVDVEMLRCGAYEITHPSDQRDRIVGNPVYLNVEVGANSDPSCT